MLGNSTLTRHIFCWHVDIPLTWQQQTPQGLETDACEDAVRWGLMSKTVNGGREGVWLKCITRFKIKIWKFRKTEQGLRHDDVGARSTASSILKWPHILNMDDKQPNSAPLLLSLMFGPFILNICRIKPADTFVILECDSRNQNWSVYCGEAAKSDMTNVGQTVQVCSQSGPCDWSSLKSITVKSYRQWASIKNFFFFWAGGEMTAERLWGEKLSEKILPFKSSL